MRVLVVGGGGREHALAWALSREAQVICAPGNPGIAEDVDIAPIAISDFDGLTNLARQRAVDLAVIGPEDPLVGGLADRLRAAGIATFGPGSDGAQIEASKAFSKQLMQASGVPTAEFETFTDAGAAKVFAARLFDGDGFGAVVKASGIALGKGAVVCDSLVQARETIDGMLVRRVFGEAGAKIVVEQRLKGFEFSLLTLVSGEDILSLPVAQDYKRALDGDAGPNTGGMGSFSPVPVVTHELVAQTEAEVVRPILRALRERGIDYRGMLYSGLMVHNGEPYCIEYNVRFGDPETQTVVRRLGAGFAAALQACATGAPIPPVEVLENHAVTVVVASDGYPESPRKGFPITLPEKPHAKIFHAGTAWKDGALVNSGGRVFSVTGVGASRREARDSAYATADQIKFEGAWRRSDIALT